MPPLPCPLLINPQITDGCSSLYCSASTLEWASFFSSIAFFIFGATIEKRDKWYIGWVDAPGAFSQGRTVKEVEENLREAVQLILESQRDLRGRGVVGKVLKKEIQVQV